MPLTTLFVKSSKIVLPSVATSCTHDAFNAPNLPQIFFSIKANTWVPDWLAWRNCWASPKTKTQSSQKSSLTCYSKKIKYLKFIWLQNNLTDTPCWLVANAGTATKNLKK